ncbi:ogr/Delta-like zinc finger family protein [Comamonas sp. Y33R10-2]|nr:ogr/Delta-like zinc finger family protein [Comamonas sp. Y33R10-2]
MPASQSAQARNTVQQAPGGRVSAGCKESTRQECPHCETPCLIRSSQKMSRLTRELIYWCTNPECGHTFVALMEVVRTLSPSATPDPSVSLPLSSHVRREMLLSQLEHAGTAAHETRFTRPVTGDLFTGGSGPPE